MKNTIERDVEIFTKASHKAQGVFLDNCLDKIETNYQYGVYDIMFFTVIVAPKENHKELEAMGADRLEDPEDTKKFFASLGKDDNCHGKQWWECVETFGSLMELVGHLRDFELIDDE